MPSLWKTAMVLLVACFVNAGSAVAWGAKRSTPPPPPPDPFTSYVVSVRSLRLVNVAGISVEAAPRPVSLDLAQVVDLEDAVQAGLIPAGEYVSATLVLDFSRAEVTVPGANGTVVRLQPVDSTGSPITGTRTVSMRLDGYGSFVVSQKSAALYALDARLLASNTVYPSGGTVTVGSEWAATVVPSGNQWIRLSGRLSAVAGTTSSFTLSVTQTKTRVYNAVATGDIALLTTPTTSFTIGGSTLVGTAGSSALATYPRGTSVTATGSLQPDGKTLVASLVVVN
jgi:hypothetical protein